MSGPVVLPQLRAELLRRSQADQDARFAYLDARDRGEDADWAPVHAVDEDNPAFLIGALGEHGWLGSDLVGADGAHACWLLIQHAPAQYQDQWLPLMEHAVAAGTASASDLVYLQDRVNLHPQPPPDPRLAELGHPPGPHATLAGDRPRHPQHPPQRGRPSTPTRGHHRQRLERRRATGTRARNCQRAGAGQGPDRTREN